MKRIKVTKETELYPPIKEHFQDLGYDVHGEVKDCDVVAIKDEDMIILELKLKFNLKLVYQCLDRKKSTKNVYAVIEAPKGGLFNKDNKRMVDLLKRLEIGLFFVYFYESGNKVEMILEPTTSSTRMNKKKSASIKKEISKRSGSYNEGGARGGRVTAFKEASIHVAVLLHIHGEKKISDLKKLGAPDNSQSILYHNYYGWFQRVTKGVYTLSDDGKNVIDEFKDISTYYLNKYSAEASDEAEAMLESSN